MARRPTTDRQAPDQPSKLEPWLLLPSWMYWAACGAVTLTLGLSYSARWSGSDVDTLPETFSSFDEACALAGPARSPLQPRATTVAEVTAGKAAAPTSSCSNRCTEQIEKRGQQIADVREQLRIACQRKRALADALEAGEPLARQALREEKAELTAQYRALRQLRGPKRDAESNSNVINLGVTGLLGLLALFAFGRHANSVGIGRCLDFKDIRRPFWLTASATFLVAATVTIIESLQINKTSFDWSSYCLSHVAFVVNHAVLLPVTFTVAVQLSAGFFAMGAPHPLEPDPKLPAWGMRRYVVFLETWCLLIVVIVGAVAALWLRTLANDRSPTNIVVSFMGWGALAATATLIWRIVRTAIALRDKCELLALALPLGIDKAPADPTEGLLGKNWWQMPSVLVAASGIAWWLLGLVDAGRLYTGGP